MDGFIAYPSNPPQIAKEIRAGVNLLHGIGFSQIKTWEENDIAGRFLVDPILGGISESTLFVADITTLNFNVAYEIGYAIGKSKRMLLVRNTLLHSDVSKHAEIGILDTLGYKSYQTGSQLSDLVQSVKDLNALPLGNRHSSGRPQIFLVEPKEKDTYDICLTSAIKKSKTGFERYEPTEKGRLPALYAIREICQADAFVARLLSNARIDSVVHNFRVAFCAGVASAIGTKILLLQDTEEPVPLDYRELVVWTPEPDRIGTRIAELVLELWDSHQERVVKASDGKSSTFISKVDFGVSIAENETRRLDDYYLETADFRRAVNGDFQVISGRKGAGKTAFFIQLRNKLRRDPKKLVLDLTPEGYQLIKFKETTLRFLSEGSKEHLLQALWEYVLLLEIAFRILRDDAGKHINDHRLTNPYLQISRFIQDRRNEDPVFGAGDFAERLEHVLQGVSRRLTKVTDGKSDKELTHQNITEVLYTHEIRTLVDCIRTYAGFKSGIWILVDNLDKGWSATGITAEDVRIIRCLQTGLFKLEKSLRDLTHCRGVVFLRSDVFQHLIRSSSDRGKLQSTCLDLTSRDILKQILVRRIQDSLGTNDELDAIWPNLFVSNISTNAQDSCEYILDRCLMRPRCLIDIVRACQGSSVTLGHERVLESDIKDGLESYSVELANNIGLEIADIYHGAPDVIFALVGRGRRISKRDLQAIIQGAIPEDAVEEFLNLIVWYGLVGPIDADGRSHFIFDHKYEMRLLAAVHSALPSTIDPMFEINPAFWAALEIDDI